MAVTIKYDNMAVGIQFQQTLRLTRQTSTGPESPVGRAARHFTEMADPTTEKIVMTPLPKRGNTTAILVERVTAPPPEMAEPGGDVHVAGGDHQGIVVNKSSKTDYASMPPAHLSLEFKVFLVSATTSRHTQESRTLRFWFKPYVPEAEQARYSQEFFKELVSPLDFPRDYVGFIKKVMKLMQTKYIDLKRTELLLCQLGESDSAPIRPNGSAPTSAGGRQARPRPPGSAVSRPVACPRLQQAPLPGLDSPARPEPAAASAHSRTRTTIDMGSITITTEDGEPRAYPTRTWVTGTPPEAERKKERTHSGKSPNAGRSAAQAGPALVSAAPSRSDDSRSAEPQVRVAKDLIRQSENSNLVHRGVPGTPTATVSPVYKSVQENRNAISAARAEYFASIAGRSPRNLGTPQLPRTGYVASVESRVTADSGTTATQPQARESAPSVGRLTAVTAAQRWPEGGGGGRRTVPLRYRGIGPDGPEPLTTSRTRAADLSGRDRLSWPYSSAQARLTSAVETAPEKPRRPLSIAVESGHRPGLVYRPPGQQQPPLVRATGTRSSYRLALGKEESLLASSPDAPRPAQPPASDAGFRHGFADTSVGLDHAGAQSAIPSQHTSISEPSVNIRPTSIPLGVTTGRSPAGVSVRTAQQEGQITVTGPKASRTVINQPPSSAEKPMDVPLSDVEAERRRKLDRKIASMLKSAPAELRHQLSEPTLTANKTSEVSLVTANSLPEESEEARRLKKERKIQSLLKYASPEMQQQFLSSSSLASSRSDEISPSESTPGKRKQTKHERKIRSLLKSANLPPELRKQFMSELSLSSCSSNQTPEAQTPDSKSASAPSLPAKCNAATEGDSQLSDAERQERLQKKRERKLASLLAKASASTDSLESAEGASNANKLIAEMKDNEGKRKTRTEREVKAEVNVEALRKPNGFGRSTDHRVPPESMNTAPKMEEYRERPSRGMQTSREDPMLQHHRLVSSVSKPSRQYEAPEQSLPPMTTLPKRDPRMAARQEPKKEATVNAEIKFGGMDTKADGKVQSEIPSGSRDKSSERSHQERRGTYSKTYEQDTIRTVPERPLSQSRDQRSSSLQRSSKRERKRSENTPGRMSGFEEYDERGSFHRSSGREQSRRRREEDSEARVSSLGRRRQTSESSLTRSSESVARRTPERRRKEPADRRRATSESHVPTRDKHEQRPTADRLGTWPPLTLESRSCENLDQTTESVRRSARPVSPPDGAAAARPPSQRHSQKTRASSPPPPPMLRSRSVPGPTGRLHFREAARAHLYRELYRNYRRRRGLVREVAVEAGPAGRPVAIETVMADSAEAVARRERLLRLEEEILEELLFLLPHGLRARVHDVSPEEGHSNGEVELTEAKVLELIEQSYPNPITVQQMAKQTYRAEEEVQLHLGALTERGAVRPLETGGYTRVQQSDAHEVTVVKQMPTVVSSKQPTIAIITANYCEKLAVDAMIVNKETFVRFTTVGESNVYTLGNIGAHRVVSTKLPTVGHTRGAVIAAGSSTTRLLGCFQQVEHVFLVGVGGGVPHYTDYSRHVRLGDVVVSAPTPGQRFIYLHCERAGELDSGAFEFETKSWGPPCLDLQKIAELLKQQGEEHPESAPWVKYLDEGQQRLLQQDAAFQRPPADTDKLYMSIGEKEVIEVAHPAPAETASNLRELGRPMVHLGPVASGRQVVSHDQMRQEFSSQVGILAYDAEYDSVVESIYGNRKDNYVFIRGIADYKDGSRGREWQPYSALTAASFMKAVICAMDPPKDA